MANIRALTGRIERLEECWGQYESSEIIETLIAWSDALSEREHKIYLLALGDLSIAESPPSLESGGRYRQSPLEFLPEFLLDEDHLAEGLARQKEILTDLVEKLADVEEVWDYMVRPNPHDHQRNEKWWAAMEWLLIAARDDAPDLEERKAELRRCAWRPQPVPDLSPWPVRREEKMEDAKTLQEDTSMLAEMQVASAVLSANLVAIEGKETVTVRYTGSRRGNWNLTLYPAKRTVTLSAIYSDVRLSGDEARWLFEHPVMKNEFEVVE